MKQELQDMIAECSTELTDIGSKLSELSALDKARSYLTKYALIRTCGTIEFVYRSIVADFFDQFNIGQIETYLEHTVRNGSMSCTYENMWKLLKKFDDNWEHNFKQAVSNHQDSNRLISSARSLVNNRHLFAHGKTPTATYADICQYYRDALVLVGIFDSVVI